MSGGSDTWCQEFTTLSYLPARKRAISRERGDPYVAALGGPTWVERSGAAELRANATETGANLLHGVTVVVPGGSDDIAQELLVGERQAVVLK